MAQVTRATLRAMVRIRGDLRDPQTTDAEIHTEIDRAHRALRAVLSQWDPQRYATLATVPILAGTAAYALPADHDSTLAVTMLGDDGAYRVVAPLALRHIDGYGGDEMAVQDDVRYSLRDAYMVLSPTPTAATTLRHWYVAQPAALASDSAYVDLPAGGEEWLAYDAAIPLVLRAGRSIGEMVAMAGRVESRMRATMSRRDRGGPQQLERGRGATVGASWRR